MKRFFLLITLFILSFSFVSAIKAEEIKNYQTDIKINTDGTVDITESITYDFGTLNRHGIYRDIPEIKVNRDGKKYKLKYDNFSVTNTNGSTYKYSTIKENNNIRLKIGDPDRTITGIHDYIISYRVSGAVTYFSDHDELYWNSTGNMWEVPINFSRTTIEFPTDVTGGNFDTACFTGVEGSQEKNCISNIVGNLATFETNEGLGVMEGLTVVYGFPKNIIDQLEPVEYIPFWETMFGKTLGFILIVITIIVLIGWYLIAPIYIIYKWFKEGRDPKGTVEQVTAWYDPPRSVKTDRFLTPGEVGTLGDESADLKDISATIIDLARRGYLKIEERSKKDFYLIKNDHGKKIDDLVLLPFEQTLMAYFFKTEPELRLKTSKLFDDVEKVKKDLYEAMVTQGLFPKNPQTVRAVYYVISFISLFTFNIFLAVVALTFGRAMPRKTVDGVNAKNIAASLKNFLTSQSRQLKFHADKQLMFERLLPYAIAFGVEKIWAKRFENIALKNPNWYSGYGSGSHFNSIFFVNSMNSSLSSFSKAATPVSSSTGHSSGFSGGSSGGGGGGGGGGSW